MTTSSLYELSPEMKRQATLELKRRIRGEQALEKVYILNHIFSDFINEGGYFEPETPSEANLLEFIKRVEKALKNIKTA